MRVLALLPTYGSAPPTGAHVTTREYVHGLVAAGHQVDVVTTTPGASAVRTEDGVRVWPLGYWWRAVQAVRPELVLSHHGDRRAPGILGQVRGVPHLLLVHGMSATLQLGRPALAWFPSEACRAHYPAYRGPSLVSPPPINPDQYRTTPGQLVTLNGSTAAKGADVLAAVAEQLPDIRFLVVRAAGHQVLLGLPNVELVDRMDPRQLYARTRLLLMPSTRESYGRVGVEAMLSGIPVIAAPLPGIREALGHAAVYVPRDDPARWAAEIRRLDDPAAYTAAADTARAHADRQDYDGNLAAFTEACESLHKPRPAAAPRRRPAAAPLPPSRPDAVAWVHYSVPYRRAGSETMLQTMMRALKTAGLQVLVVVSQMPEAPAAWDVDGVPHRKATPASAEALLRSIRPKAIVSHHGFAERAILLAKAIGSKSLLVLHSDFELNARAFHLQPDLCVYNTEWIIRSLAPRYAEVDRIPRLIVHPPVIPEEHRAPATGHHVTLVNLSREKGVNTWCGAAELCRELPFLGVTGAHGQQHPCPVPPNARVIPQTSNMRDDVWARTGVLLAPSIYESYGMAAVEALASGIPVIAHPTPGLQEALGDAATFLERADVPAWAAAIKELSADGDRRAAATAAAFARSAFLADQARQELKLWADAIQELVSA
ncbi:glycosyltransferase family 4 protein [Streptomyces carpinensis]|uniref:D-inositol 3-phosphate glycosyltransferase n=1 Tax=Streptomyces carpinensis TaxID=66369 RepID=A0ABV1VW27_9ACTN|nr:glycosyltransferase family 4 protein [Streptomyces carpinensis]